jgi:hypothetical protein
MENAQIEVVEKFTDCFLKTAGHEAYEHEKHLAGDAHAYMFVSSEPNLA